MADSTQSDAANVHPAWDRSLPLWIVTNYGPGMVADTQDAAYVHADTPENAAIYGANVLGATLDLAEGSSFDDVTSVHVMGVEPLADRVVYTIAWEPTPRLADLQCCGGHVQTDDGHSGYCKDRERDG